LAKAAQNRQTIEGLVSDGDYRLSLGKKRATEAAMAVLLDERGLDLVRRKADARAVFNRECKALDALARARSALDTTIYVGGRRQYGGAVENNYESAGDRAIYAHLPELPRILMDELRRGQDLREAFYGDKELPVLDVEADLAKLLRDPAAKLG
jgi:hypothetical protein